MILKNKQLSLGNASHTQIKTDEGDLCCLNYWGDTLHYIANVDVNRYSLVEVGLTELGLSLCRNIESFYHAISYSEPGYVPVEYQTLHECIAGAIPLVDLLTDIQNSAHERFKTINSFTGKYGAIPTKTLQCMVDTVNGWKSQVRRLSHFDHILTGKILTHTLTNESWIEFFSFWKEERSGASIRHEGVCYCKRKHAVHFQMKMCDLPFCSDEKNKVRDKDYQTLANNKKTYHTSV